MNTAMADEDHGNLLRERKHKVLHLQMLRAIFDRANDESGTLRTRSLVILTKLLTSKHVPLINAIEVSREHIQTFKWHSHCIFRYILFSVDFLILLQNRT